MLPERFRLNYIVVPTFLAVFVALVTVTCVVGAIDDRKYLPVIIVNLVLSVALIAAMVPFGLTVAKKELAVAIAEHAYFFEAPAPQTEGVGVDEELGVKALFKLDGVTLVYPKRGEEVFEELGEETEFLPWADIRFALASDNFARRVKLALVLLDGTKRLGEEVEPYFLTMTKELYATLVGLDLCPLVGGDFAYLLKNPVKGIKQILDFGYIRKIS